MKTYRVGIVGCGNIFPMHAVSINRLENAKLVAVCDNKEDRAKEKAKEFNCDYYTDYMEMIDKAQLDVVHVCTPHYMHAPIVLYAAEKKKHILTEKPMSIHLKDATQMVEEAEKNNVTLGVIFQNRYNAGSVLIKENLDNGRLGKIIAVKSSVTWNRSDEYYSQSDWKGTWDKEGGGVIIDQAIHTLDLARWFINDKIDYVDATIANRAHNIIEVEDAADGVVAFKNGVLMAFYTINYYSYDAEVEIQLHCENGVCDLKGDKATIRFNDNTTLNVVPDLKESMDFGDGVKQYWGVSHTKQIENYYNALMEGREPFISGRDALETQRMICAIYEAGKSGEKVRLVP